MDRDSLMRGAFAVIRREIDPLFAPGSRFAFIGFLPGDTEDEIVVTDEQDIDALIAVLTRAKQRTARAAQGGET